MPDDVRVLNRCMMRCASRRAMLRWSFRRASSSGTLLRSIHPPAVRLVDQRSGKPVTDAVVFAKRLDMAPDAMEEMATKVEQVPSTEPGVYRFKS